MNKNIVLMCKSVWFYSTTDEDLFFEWIKRIPSIVKYDGKGDELYLYFTSNTINDDDLRELLALFYRYKIDMKQLSVFLNEENKEWFFERSQSYWHKKVFSH